MIQASQALSDVRIFRILCPQARRTAKSASPIAPFSGHRDRRPSVFYVIDFSLDCATASDVGNQLGCQAVSTEPHRVYRQLYSGWLNLLEVGAVRDHAVKYAEQLPGRRGHPPCTRLCNSGVRMAGQPDAACGPGRRDPRRGPALARHEQDPTGAFTRRWVPELAAVPDIYLQEPWRWSGAGQLLGRRYPEPVVDPAAAARAARDRIFALRRAEGFGTEQARIAARHASRASPLTRARQAMPREVILPAGGPQLSLDL